MLTQVYVYISDSKKVCDDYDVTTTAEVSDEDDEPRRRNVKRRWLDDFVTGILYVHKHSS